MKEPVGSVAEEAAKLFAVLQHAASAGQPPAETHEPAEPEPAQHESAQHESAQHESAQHESAQQEQARHEPAGGEHEHKLGPDCVWCPVCQLIHRVRNTSPETIEQLSTAAAHVLGSLRSLLEAAAEAARQAREDAASRSSRPDEEPAQQAAQESARSRVDRIDVSEDPEPWD